MHDEALGATKTDQCRGCGRGGNALLVSFLEDHGVQLLGAVPLLAPTRAAVIRPESPATQ
jgi:hypothetical protein